MGATIWRYIVPFQSDANKALQELRQDIFARNPKPPPQVSIEQATSLFEQVLQTRTDKRLAERERKAYYTYLKPMFEEEARKPAKPSPRTINELLEQCGEDGTGTILDIDRVSLTRQFGSIYPVPYPELFRLYGTVRPTRALIENAETAYSDLYGRWEGICVTVHDADTPIELYFEGCSGD